MGVEVLEHSAPTLRGNKIHHCRLNGLQVYKEAKGLYEGNEIYGHTHACVRIWEVGDPTFNGNKIHSSKACGVLIYECGKGHFVDNDIYDHRDYNVEVKRRAFPILERNRISGGGQGGVYCHDGGGIHPDSFRDKKMTTFRIIENTVTPRSNAGEGNSKLSKLAHLSLSFKKRC